MTPVILVTFAGRQKRMEILTHYIRQAMARGIIDEWHIWDFTRSQHDHEWVTQEFGPVRYMECGARYQLVGTVADQTSFRTTAAISNDLHIAILPHDDKDHFYEIVVGGWDNQYTALRKMPRSELLTFERTNESEIWSRTTPGILSPGIPNQIVLKSGERGVQLYVNHVNVGQWNDLRFSLGASIMIRGGWGANLELGDTRSRTQRFLGNPEEKPPYSQAYNYYATRLQNYSDTIFLKCDDDIVYIDIDKLDDFIEFRRSNPNYFIVSANVVNNGVCAYWQQAAGSLPEHLGQFEWPQGGFGGSLWQSGMRANELHDHFLKTHDKRLPLPAKVVEWTERQSINFIAWLGKDLVHMALPKSDDEGLLTIELPALLNRPTAIYSDLMVSHLSFGPQENEIDADRLIDAYGALLETTIGKRG
ncbi:hypothetical protein [Rhizobium sp. AG207R]|uniref:hypothetical protein n=1 Tax=Rhizobium sp. AG207R TaxID=2802287 RepID=UPI0022AC2C40|nr:hypothetical protein [Rhizobium sp. AG207R]MCZ3374378.1 hypothetical protein [Rhizobium sp. AG207R]